MVPHTFYGSLAMMGRPPEGTQPNQTGEFLKMIPMIMFFFLVMYFLMIRPQQKKAREHAQLVKTLKAGDRVLTSGGVLGPNARHHPSTADPLAKQTASAAATLRSAAASGSTVTVR